MSLKQLSAITGATVLIYFSSNITTENEISISTNKQLNNVKVPVIKCFNKSADNASFLLRCKITNNNQNRTLYNAKNDLFQSLNNIVF